MWKPLLLAAVTAGCSAAPAPVDTPAPAPPTTPAPPPTSAAVTYRLETPERWQRIEGDGFETFVDPDGTVKLHVMETSEGDLAKAIEAAFAKTGASEGLVERQRAGGAPDPRFREQLAITLTDASDERFAQGIAMAHGEGGRTYVFVLAGPTKDVRKRGAELSRIVSSLEVEGAARIAVKAADRKPFDETRREALYAFVEKARARVGVPGVALAVVTPEGTFTRGFGVREMGGDAPVDADTQMMIGSITKSFSTLLLATLVDDGKLRWDQPAKEAYPAFRLGDRTDEIQMQHLFCACTGAARQDMELIFEFANKPPRAVFGDVAAMKLTTAFGETFQYNNQLTAAGGYIAGMAATGSADPSAAYAKALRARVLDKIGMADSTIDLGRVRARKNHAMPHGLELSGETTVVPLAQEGFVAPVAPAGALWSTANDMAKYLALQLGRGAIGEARVVSEENLARTQTVQAKVSHDKGYGMGWIVGTYRGLKAVEHSGGTIGFNSDLVFFPEIGVGLFIVANRSPAAMNGAVRARLIELLFDLEPRIDADHEKDTAELRRLMGLELAKATDAPVADDLLGAYDGGVLGAITIARDAEGRAVLDAGEWKGRLALYDPQERPDTLLLVSGPVRGTTLQITERDGKKALLLKHSQTDYVLTKR